MKAAPAMPGPPLSSVHEAGRQGAFLRRGWRGGPSTRPDPTRDPAPDLVNRHFRASAPDRLWVADATGIPCDEGVFRLAAVRDTLRKAAPAMPGPLLGERYARIQR